MKNFLEWITDKEDGSVVVSEAKKQGRPKKRVPSNREIAVDALSDFKETFRAQTREKLLELLGLSLKGGIVDIKKTNDADGYRIVKFDAARDIINYYESITKIGNGLEKTGVFKVDLGNEIQKHGIRMVTSFIVKPDPNYKKGIYEDPVQMMRMMFDIDVARAAGKRKLF